MKEKILEVFNKAHILEDNSNLTIFELFNYEIVSLEDINKLLNIGYFDITIEGYASDWERSDLKIALSKIKNNEDIQFNKKTSL